MGLFNRKQTSTTPADPAMAELGREYANARRHGDRKTMNKIRREINTSDQDLSSFADGMNAYDAVPPAYSRRNCRR
ncbi:hypothetical protein [Streptomyces xanthochromogenes]|uniref:Uncharacterized protein n=1 Tax=Streptomyces xanthochromogenes TaxID=67384 RepID=A0ABQ3AJV5_9ACTN|nr:hypothetical protein [Streptomyces xanthochromogenes]GGY57196.1 hypothetical protein GCM10010326_59750 [Streptomyces xanthochromogenes]